MKTIEEAAQEIFSKRANQSKYDISNAFKDGVAFAEEWLKVDDEMPPSSDDLLAKSPEGIIHLTNWRPAYNIFCCQNKYESTIGWTWRPINRK